jgi:hypothetical protein
VGGSKILEWKMKLNKESNYDLVSPLSRRSMIKNVTLAVGAATAVAYSLSPVSTSAKQSKLAQTDIGYRDRPNGGQRCDLCVNWQAPSACKVVAGTISPSGWCGLFVRRA